MLGLKSVQVKWTSKYDPPLATLPFRTKCIENYFSYFKQFDDVLIPIEEQHAWKVASIEGNSFTQYVNEL